LHIDWQEDIMGPARFLVACLALLLSAPALAQPAVDSAAWQRVDAARPGTVVQVTLKSGVKRSGKLLRATAEDITLSARKYAGVGQPDVPSEETLAKASIAIVSIPDSVKDGAGIGTLIGLGVGYGMAVAATRGCGRGCVDNGAGGAVLLFSLLGGLGLGLIADASSSNEFVLYPIVGEAPPEPKSFGKYFPRRSSLRVGAFADARSTASATLDGSASGSGFAATYQAGPWINVHGEYTAINGRFVAKPGLVSEEVSSNVVPATARIAGWSRGIVSREPRFSFATLIGVQPRPFGRVRLELLGGVETVAVRRIDYYDAWTREARIPGKYMALDFEVPDVGWVTGVDAEIAVARGFRIVPRFRYHAGTDPGPSTVFGLATTWRF
jgi:hypothetical protein